MPHDPPLLEMPLWTISGAWIRVSCACGRSASIPTRMLPFDDGDRLLADFMGRLRCQACGARPAKAFYADRADTFVRGGPVRGRRVWLLR